MAPTPDGRPIASDPYFSLMADVNGMGFVHCGDAVAVAPLTDEGELLLIWEYSPACAGNTATLVTGSLEAEESLEEAAN